MKNWLKRNEIYFQTLTSLLLSFMAIVVARSELLAIIEQNKILEERRDVAAISASPKFMVRRSQLKDSKSDTYKNDLLLIFNEGEVARGISAETDVIFMIEAIQKSDKTRPANTPISKKILLKDYYFVSQHTNSNSGHVLTVYGDDNNFWFFELEEKMRAAKELQNEFDMSSVNLKKETLIRVEYQTIAGEIREEFFLDTGLASSARLLSSQESEAKISLIEELQDIEPVNKNFNMSELNPKKILEILSEE